MRDFSTISSVQDTVILCTVTRKFALHGTTIQNLLHSKKMAVVQLMSLLPRKSSISDEMEVTKNARMRRRTAREGDIVTVQLIMTPEHDYVPDTLFDTCGSISFVLGWGNYLPGLHELVTGMAVGESVKDKSIDAGWGDRREDLIVTVEKSKMTFLQNPNVIQVGSKLQLKPNFYVEVIAVDEESITVDANPPLAGTSFSCTLEVTGISSNPLVDEAVSSSSSPSPYQLATFALGCFWGAELAFLRLPGIVGTKVGYTQGVVVAPTYEEVCAGHTKHREAVLVVYDERVVSYEELMAVALERLQVTRFAPLSLLFGDGHEEQYKHGFYYHNEKQKELASALLAQDNRYDIELKAAVTLYDAEEYHQKYLLKGGQSARKGAKETIRCFG